MSQLGFWTALTYNHPESGWDRARQCVDDYFFLCGNKGYVTKSKEVVISNAQSSTVLKVIKCISYIIVPIPLIMIIVKWILRRKNSFTVVDPKEALKNNFLVSESTTLTIQATVKGLLAGTIYDGHNIENVEWLPRRNGFYSFRVLSDVPCIVMINKNAPEKTRRYYDKMVTMKRASLVKECQLIEVPHAQLMEIDDNPCLIKQDCLIGLGGKCTRELLTEVVTIAMETGLEGSRLIPRPNNRGIVIDDFEEFNPSLDKVFFGKSDDGSDGLISYVSEEDIEWLVDLAKQKKVPIDTEKRNKAVEGRRKRLASLRDLNRFYSEKGIKGNEPITIDNLSELGATNITKSTAIPLGKNDTGFVQTKIILWGMVAQNMIREINRQLKENGNKETLKDKRSVTFKPETIGLSSHDFHDWFIEILEVLKEKGYIFDFSSPGYYNIQA